MLNDNLVLSDEELDIQLETIVTFLKAVHPTLRQDSNYRPCVEIRPLLRDKKTTAGYSLSIWDLNERNMLRLKDFLKRYNGQQVCLFYSVFHYDNNKEIVLSNGKKQKQNYISTKNAVGTFELALDFDDISYDEYVKLVDLFEELGIFALWVSSGHGYQAHILLEEEVRSSQALKVVVELLNAKGLKCDASCVDSARVMRLPKTFNNKCFADDKYVDEQNSPPRCEVVQSSQIRYNYSEIIEAFNSLPSVSIPKKTGDIPEDNKVVIKDEKYSDFDKINYPHIKRENLPEPVIKMLSDVPYGYRNNVLGALIRFFKTMYKLKKDQIEDILILWSATACNPAYEPEEFETDFKRLYYKYNGLSYNSTLIDKYGELDIQETITLKKKDILIPHTFSKDLNVLEGKTVRIYLALKLLEHNQETTSQQSIAEKLNITVRALRPALQALVKSPHAYVEKGNRRMKIPDLYHTNKIFSVHDGYSVYSYNDIQTYLNEFAEQNSKYNELKLYLFFRYKFYTGEIYMSQTNIGKHIGVAQNTVSDIVNRLEQKKYLKISKKYHSAALYSLEYTLLR